MEDQLFEIVHAFNDFYSFLQLKPKGMAVSEYMKPYDKLFWDEDCSSCRGHLVEYFRELFEERTWRWVNGERVLREGD